MNQGNDQLGHALQREMAEDLRQLANHYVHHAGSQVDAVCIERTSVGRYRVTIALEATDTL